MSGYASKSSTGTTRLAGNAGMDIKPDPCKNSYIYETAGDWHVKEIMRTTLVNFFPDYHIDAELVDGSRMEMELKPCWPEERKRRHQ